jgi:hypothetical protein
MDTSKATPRPWNLHRAYDGALMHVESGVEGVPDWDSAYLVISKGDRFIAHVNMRTPNGMGWPDVETEEEMRSNAALILRAVNSFDALVEALKGCEELLSAICEVIRAGNPPPHGVERLGAARAALALAEEKP